MGVDTGVSSCSCQIFTISEWNVLSIWGLVAFGETKINDVDSAFGLVSSSNQKIIWFDISMDDSLLMDDLDSLDHLDRDVENGADVELSSAFLEQVLEWLTEHIHDHDVVHFAIFGFLISNEV